MSPCPVGRALSASPCEPESAACGRARRRGCRRRRARRPRRSGARRAGRGRGRARGSARAQAHRARTRRTCRPSGRRARVSLHPAPRLEQAPSPRGGNHGVPSPPATSEIGGSRTGLDVELVEQLLVPASARSRWRGPLPEAHRENWRSRTHREPKARGTRRRETKRCDSERRRPAGTSASHASLAGQKEGWSGRAGRSDDGFWRPAAARAPPPVPPRACRARSGGAPRGRSRASSGQQASARSKRRADGVDRDPRRRKRPVGGRAGRSRRARPGRAPRRASPSPPGVA